MLVCSPGVQPWVCCVRCVYARNVFPSICASVPYVFYDLINQCFREYTYLSLRSMCTCLCKLPQCRFFYLPINCAYRPSSFSSLNLFDCTVCASWRMCGWVCSYWRAPHSPQCSANVFSFTTPKPPNPDCPDTVNTVHISSNLFLDWHPRSTTTHDAYTIWCCRVAPTNQLPPLWCWRAADVTISHTAPNLAHPRPLNIFLFYLVAEDGTGLSVYS